MSRFVAAWGLIALWYASAVSAEPTSSLRDFVQKNQTRHAVGLFLQGKKVGWMIVDFRLGQRDGQPVAVETSEMLLSLHVDGEKSVTKRRETVWYSLEGEGSIIAAEQVDATDGRETVHSVRLAEKGKLTITTTIGKETTSRTIPLPKANLCSIREMFHWLTGPRQKGDTHRHWTVDWEEEEVNHEEIYTYVGKSFVIWGGIKTDVFHIQIEMKGARFEADVLSNGNPIRGRVAIFELRAEKEETVRQLDESPVDMLTASSIKVDRPLGSSKQIISLQLEVQGVDSLRLPENHRQSLRSENGKLLLNLRQDFLVEQARPLAEEERKRFLASTPTIQASHPRIKELALKIVGAETESRGKARKIQDWVYRNLRKTMASNSTTALGVIDSMAGDCTEHTLLFVSLARAVGLPAREVTGVAHVDGLFGWHAWAEIHDGHQWISVDPTWDEFFVDATHIAFSQDPQDNAWLNVLGKIRFRVVRVERQTETEP
jgi:hypothetical protein